MIKNQNNSVKMTQKSCFLMVAEPGFGPGSGASVWIFPTGSTPKGGPTEIT